mmetsp:Transcript_119991/g.208380  ORF Transcript_119991/g.208380 Transcript_119991/m.208380 type:complete len:87 (+) Transcript_119991:3-263(+)
MHAHMCTGYSVYGFLQFLDVPFLGKQHTHQKNFGLKIYPSCSNLTWPQTSVHGMTMIMDQMKNHVSMKAAFCGSFGMRPISANLYL